MFDIEIISATDIGLVRENNEDALAYQQYQHADVSICIVADGVGGHAGGEVASQLAVDTVLDYVEKAVQQACLFDNFAKDWLIQTATESIVQANKFIRTQQRQQSHLSNMASTIVILLRHGEDVVIAHAGDSRCYCCEQNSFNQITEDHTVSQQMLNDGVLNYGEFLKSHYHHILNNGLGLSDDINIAMFQDKVMNKLYLLCTDGLSDYVSDNTIYSHITDDIDLTTCAKALVQQALKGGGMDNVSLVLFSCKSPD